MGTAIVTKPNGPHLTQPFLTQADEAKGGMLVMGAKK